MADRIIISFTGTIAEEETGRLAPRMTLFRVQMFFFTSVICVYLDKHKTYG